MDKRKFDKNKSGGYGRQSSFDKPKGRRGDGQSSFEKLRGKRAEPDTAPKRDRASYDAEEERLE